MTIPPQLCADATRICCGMYRTPLLRVTFYFQCVQHPLVKDLEKLSVKQLRYQDGLESQFLASIWLHVASVITREDLA